MASPPVRKPSPPKPHATSVVEGFEALYREGIAHLQAQRYAEATTAFEAALANNPPPERQAAILFGLADAARRVGLTRTAETYYDRVLHLDPNRLEAVVSLAHLHSTTGRTRDAQSLLNEALSTDPEAPELWLALGDLMRQSGDASGS